MKKATDIIKGHLKELFGSNSNLSKERLEICKECPIFIQTSYGPVCDSKQWISDDGTTSSTSAKSGYKRGCGCRLTAKTTLKDNHCIVNKW